MAPNTRRLMLGVLAAVAVALLIIALAPYVQGRATPSEVTATDTTAAVDTAGPELVVEPEPVVGLAAPAVETFYMAPDGVATIAGRGESNQTIAILLSRDVIATVQTDAAGNFATTVLLEPSSAPRRLSLLADPDGANVASAEAFIVAPTAIVKTESLTPTGDIVLGTLTPDPADTILQLSGEVADVAVTQDTAVADAGGAALISPTQLDTAAAQADPVADAPVNDDVEATDLAVAVVDMTADSSSDDADAAGGNTDAVAVATTGQTADPSTPDAKPPKTPTVIVADSDGVRVVQDDRAPDVMSAIALDTITYDPAGEVTLAGRAASGEFVRVYVNNRPVTTSPIEGGGWSTVLPQVETGVYTLRIDEVDDEGTVVSRIETPFKREEAEAVAAVMAEETAADGFDVAVRTVQPGTTLWAIAREELGDGIMYVAVFEANRDLIKNPDLIYPGQVFRIPQVVE